MMSEEAGLKRMPLTQNFIRTLHKTLLCEDYTVYRMMYFHISRFPSLDMVFGLV